MVQRTTRTRRASASAASRHDSSPEEDTDPGADRRAANRRVAEREAGRLARPEARAVGSLSLPSSARAAPVSSTPFGDAAAVVSGAAKRRRTEGGGDDGSGGGREEEEEEDDVDEASDDDAWCGPFSVARRMIARREKARRKREAEMKRAAEAAPRHPLDDLTAEVERKALEKMRPSLKWKPTSAIPSQETMAQKDGRTIGGPDVASRKCHRRLNAYTARKLRAERGNSSFNVPSLYTLSLDALVSIFDQVDDDGSGLGPDVGADIRKSIADALVEHNALDSKAFGILAADSDQVEVLDIVDCSGIDRNIMAKAVGTISRERKGGVLKLGHAGRCFGPEAVRELAGNLPGATENSSSSYTSSIFALSLEGAYLLGEADYTLIVASTFRSLSSIELRACPKVGAEFCRSLVDHYSRADAAPLLELQLENIKLSEEAVSILFSSPSIYGNIRNLRLDHIPHITDAVVSSFLSAASGTLESLTLSHVDVTDATFGAIREANVSRLRSLNLCGLRQVTSAALEAIFTVVPGDGSGAVAPPPVLRSLQLSSLPENSVTDDVLRAACAAASADNDTMKGRRGGGTPAVAGLVRIDVSGAGKAVTDVALEEIAATCGQSLVELDLSYCHAISDRGLGYLVSEVGGQFRRLTLWGCAQVTDIFLDGHSRVQSKDSVAALEVVGAWMRRSGSASVR